MQRKSPKPIKWKLKPLQAVRLGWFDGGKPLWEMARRNPLLPLFIALGLAFVSGFKYVLPAKLAIVALALWLFLDLRPLAKAFAVRRINSDQRFSGERTSSSPQLASVERKQIETIRDKALKQTRSVCSLALFVAISCASCLAIMYVSERAYAELREDVWQNMEADAAVPSEDSVSTAEITVRNKSNTDVLLRSFRCATKKLVLSDGSIFTNSGFGDKFDAVLKRGGDGQSLPCTPNGDLTAVNRTFTRCADVEWHVYYSIPSHPNQIEEKSYRYILQPGHGRWEQVAIGVSSDPCRDYH